MGLTRSISEGADRRAELKRAHLRHGAVESSWRINVEETIWSCDDLIILIASTVGLRSTVRSKVVGEFQDTLGGRDLLLLNSAHMRGSVVLGDLLTIKRGEQGAPPLMV